MMTNVEYTDFHHTCMAPMNPKVQGKRHKAVKALQPGDFIWVCDELCRERPVKFLRATDKDVCLFYFERFEGGTLVEDSSYTHYFMRKATEEEMKELKDRIIAEVKYYF